MIPSILSAASPALASMAIPLSGRGHDPVEPARHLVLLAWKHMDVTQRDVYALAPDPLADAHGVEAELCHQGHAVVPQAMDEDGLQDRLARVLLYPAAQAALRCREHLVGRRAGAKKDIVCNGLCKVPL